MNTKEMMQALLSGETIVDATDGERRWLCEDSGNIRSSSRNPSWVPRTSGNWKIYKKPEWCNNIPEGGVLCWVGLSGKVITPIIKHDPSIPSPFIDANGPRWVDAIPLTRAEIQVYMDKALEENKK